MDRSSIKHPSAPQSATLPTIAELRARNKSYETVNWVIGLCAGSGALTRIQRTQEVRIFKHLSSPDYRSPYITPQSTAPPSVKSTASSAQSTSSSTRSSPYSSLEFEAKLSTNSSSLTGSKEEQWANLVGGNIIGIRELSPSFRSPWKKPNFGIEFRYRMTKDQVVDDVKKPELPGCKSLYGGQWFKPDGAEVVHFPKFSGDSDGECKVLPMRNQHKYPDGFDEISETRAFMRDLKNLNFALDTCISAAMDDAQKQKQCFPLSHPTSDDGFVTDESDAEESMPSWKIRWLEVEAMDPSERRPPAKRPTAQECVEANRRRYRLRAIENKVARQKILQEEENRRRAAERCGRVYRPGQFMLSHTEVE